MGEEEQEKNPRMLSGFCSMWYKEEPCTVKESDQLSNPYHSKCGHCGALALRSISVIEEGERYRRRNKIGNATTTIYEGNSPFGVRDNAKMMLHLAILRPWYTCASRATCSLDYVFVGVRLR